MIVGKKRDGVENLLNNECRSRAAWEIVYREKKAQTFYKKKVITSLMKEHGDLGAFRS